MRKPAPIVVTDCPDFDFFPDEKNIAVGLSGGGDSMALGHMLCDWAEKNNKTIHALTVDHGLRENSKAEAMQVRAWAHDFLHCHHEILTWVHDEKPETAVMERARQSRYTLMRDYCIQRGIRTLCVAHHADDQAETVLFRLAKGSGLDGLAAMRTDVDMDGIRLYRPLLAYSHADLIAYCKAHNVPWIEDPSNANTDYARPRLRQALAAEGLDAKRMVKTVERLGRARDALDWMTDQAIKAARIDDMHYHWDVLQTYPYDIVVRVLSCILEKTGGNDNGYPPKLERVEAIAQSLRPGKSATLHGCVIVCTKDGKTLEFRRAAA